MAKNSKSLDKTLSKAIDDILKDYKAAMKEAVKFAAKQTEKDMMAKAHSCLQEYYDNYDPNRYDRTDTLQYAFLPYSKITYGSDKITGSVGVEYSADMLEQMMPPPEYTKNGRLIHSGYYGSAKYQPVDTAWVIDNYLRGVHPYTDGGVEYYEILDSESPDKKMNDFIREYDKTFDENVLAGLLAQIAKKMS